MATRIEIELTSARDDGTWTWRAAGARQPKGVVDAALLPNGAAVGDVLRADADVDLDGITVLSVLPPKGKRREPERIEIIGTPADFKPVTSSLMPKSERSERRPRRDRGDRPDGGPRPERRDRVGGGPRPERSDRDRPDRDRPDRGRPDRAPGGPTGAPRAGAPRGDRGDRGPGRPDGARRPRAEGTERGQRSDRPGRADTAAAATGTRARPKRLAPGRAHRDAVVAALPPEQQPVAEQLLRGGIPAVRAAIDEQNAKRRADGEPEVKADALLTLAEGLLPQLRTAEWRDKAEAALAAADDIGLRDLRAVVAGADAARDDESRQLASTLRDALERRTNELRQHWLDEIGTAIEEGRVVRAVRISGRPPEPGMRFPADAAERLAAATGAAMAADTPPDRWVAVLDAVLTSPIRRTVQPAGLPPDPPPDLLHAARMAASRVPALVALLGLERAPIPPPPVRAGVRPPAPVRRPPAPATAPASPPPAPATAPAGPPSAHASAAPSSAGQTASAPPVPAAESAPASEPASAAASATPEPARQAEPATE